MQIEKNQVNTDSKPPSPEIDRIIAIAQQVEKECPHYFEQVFKAIIDLIYEK